MSSAIAGSRERTRISNLSRLRDSGASDRPRHHRPSSARLQARRRRQPHRVRQRGRRRALRDRSVARQDWATPRERTIGRGAEEPRRQLKFLGLGAGVSSVDLFLKLGQDNDPLVYAQEYLAEFVDWSCVAFFSREKLLVGNQPLPLPTRCDGVFAVIGSASKTGADNDATAVTFFAVDKVGPIPLLVLDWSIAQLRGRSSRSGCLRCLPPSKSRCDSVMRATVRSAPSSRTRIQGRFCYSRRCGDK
jgi:hypothetical protein